MIFYYTTGVTLIVIFMLFGTLIKRNINMDEQILELDILKRREFLFSTIIIGIIVFSLIASELTLMAYIYLGRGVFYTYFFMAMIFGAITMSLMEGIFIKIFKVRIETLIVINIVANIVITAIELIYFRKLDVYFTAFLYGMKITVIVFIIKNTFKLGFSVLKKKEIFSGIIIINFIMEIGALIGAFRLVSIIKTRGTIEIYEKIIGEGLEKNFKFVIGILVILFIAAIRFSRKEKREIR